MTLRPVSEVPLPDREIIELVRRSSVDVPEGSARLARSFYDNLFKMVPAVRSMFADDIRPQQQRMADALLTVVRHLDDPDEVARQLRRLGRQHHRELGVQPEHYPYVGRALVRAVSEVSPTWSSSMSSAWVLVYQWIAAQMVAGAEAHPSPTTTLNGEPPAPPPSYQTSPASNARGESPAPSHAARGRESSAQDPHEAPPVRHRAPARPQAPGRTPPQGQDSARSQGHAQTPPPVQAPSRPWADAAGRGPR